MKRLLAAFLAMIMLLSVTAATTTAVETTPTEAAQTQPTEATEPVETTEPEEKIEVYTSDEAIRLLKLEEGFSTYPYWDYAQWTVGYGTKCPDDKLQEYRQNGISEAAAEALLRQFILDFEAELFAFMDKTGIQLSQQQFDALMLFSYNCGTAWTHESGGLMYQAIAGGATGSELVNAFARWCNAGGEIKTFLLRRRLCEANIYLNGEYSQVASSKYGYVLYDANGGTVKPNVQGYDTEQGATILANASRSGYTFQGWYTALTGGNRVEKLDASVRNFRLYARWSQTVENKPTQDVTEGTEETGITVTVSAKSLNVRTGPGTNYPVTGSVRDGDQLIITDTAEGSGYLWGKYRGGWVCLDYTNYKTLTEPEETPSQPATKMGTVKVNDTLRIRKGPSTGYEVVGYLKNGDRVEILEEKVQGAMIWGRLDSGWISMDYVVLDQQSPAPEQPEEPQPTEPKPTEPQPTEPEPTQPQPTEPVQPETPEIPDNTTNVRTGTVKVADVLRVRSGAGTNHSVVGYLRNGDRVTVYEQSASGSMIWGRVDAGWISLDYVTLDPVANQPTQTWEGTVRVSDTLRVRSGPGTSYSICAYLTSGTKVTITEQRTVGSTKWGKMEKGWISLDYVELEAETETQPQTKQVTVTADCLRVRSIAGTSGSIVGYYYQGTKVEILEITTVNGTQWGKTAKGWISMDYVK